MKGRVISIALLISLLLTVPCYSQGLDNMTLDSYVADLISGEIGNRTYVDAEHIKNGGFEAEGGWKIYDANKDDAYTIERTTEMARSGSYSMKISGPFGNKIYRDAAYFVGEEEYTLSFYMYSPTDQPLEIYTKFELKNDAGEFFAVNEGGGNYPIVSYVIHKITNNNQWQKVTYKFSTPPRADKGTFYLMLKSTGTLYIDDLSIHGSADVSQDYVIQSVPSSFQNVIGDSFMDADDGWQDYDTLDGTTNFISVYTDDEVGTVARIVNDSTTTNPYVRKLIPVVPNATYQCQMWLKTNVVNGNGARIKLEYYDRDVINGRYGVGEMQSPIFRQTLGTWQRAGFKFVPPEGATHVAVYFRLYGTGDICYAAPQVHKIANPPILDFQSSAFEYSDIDKGNAYVKLIDSSIEAGSKFEFSILKGNATLYTSEVSAQAEVKHQYPMSYLAEKDVFYSLRLRYKNAQGTVLYEETQPIMKVDRPSRITTDGFFLDKNNKKMTPVMGYHIKSTDDFAKCAEAGINVLQCNPSGSQANLKKYLDAAEQAGVYLAVVLYDNSYEAGHPRNILRTKAIVESAKDHPALFCWMIQDEPLWNDPFSYPRLFDSYALIHKLDSKHPVYTCEGSQEEGILVSGICDVWGIDPYPSNLGVKRVGDCVRTIAGDNDGRKPLINILQAYNAGDSVVGGYNPTDDGIRQMAYQAFFMGATGIGYYPINDNESVLYDTDYYDAVASFNKEELPDAIGAFVTKEYRTVSEQCGAEDSVWYKLYEKENDLYLIAINREEKTNSTINIDIDTASANDSYIAELVDCSGEETVFGSGSLSLTLTPLAARKYKISTDYIGFKLKDKDGEATDMVEAGGTIQPYIKYKAGASAESLDVIVAQYKIEPDGTKQLVSVALIPISLTAGQEYQADIGSAITVSSEDDIEYGMLLWNGTKPICESIKVKQ